MKFLGSLWRLVALVRGGSVVNPYRSSLAVAAAAAAAARYDLAVLSGVGFEGPATAGGGSVGVGAAEVRAGMSPTWTSGLSSALNKAMMGGCTWGFWFLSRVSCRTWPPRLCR